VIPSPRVVHPPAKPLLLFDGECHFCRLWVRRWQQSVGDALECAPFQQAGISEQFPELRRENLEQSVHLITADGLVYRGAEAVFRSLALNPSAQWPLRLYEGSPALAGIAEAAYRFIATRRTLFSWLTRTLWGEHVERAPVFLTRWLFLRGLGIIYLIAFVSLWVQIIGLIGGAGILPATDLMVQARQALDANGVGLDRFRVLPTLGWFADSDTALRLQCALGTGLAIALILGFAPLVALGGLWILYLSLATVGQDFLGFQWDNLLLEVGLLSMFFAPCQLLPRPNREKPPPRPAVWMIRLLLFKLMFLSGVVKLASGDPLWRSLSALTRHYETQPLPNVIAWHAHHLPLWAHKTSCALMFAVELAAPFLLFAPRRLRLFSALSIGLLQVSILLSGNYTFFNWLTLLLCIAACDDFTLGRVLPRKLGDLYNRSGPSVPSGSIWRWRNAPILLIFALVIGIYLVQIVSSFGRLPSAASPLVAVYRWLSPLRSINSYGLFAVMTPDRPEIIVEGSRDGRDWKPYAFHHKPGALDRAPTFVAPHQPRLDWQMWFAALGNARQNPWFVSFCIRLLQDSPEVVGLLGENPFPGSPPKYIRARLYQYHFTNPEERRRTGNWWKRELQGEYLPPISLEMLQRTSQPP
jgi:lipase maturation factor 1